MGHRHHGIVIVTVFLVAGSLLATIAGLFTARLLDADTPPNAYTGTMTPRIWAIRPASAWPSRMQPGISRGTPRNETVIAKTSPETWPPLMQARPTMALRKVRSGQSRDTALAPCPWGRCQDI